MGLSKVGVANRALDHIGKDRIASLTENSTAARKVNEVFDSVLVSVLERAPWTFGRTIRVLAEVTNDWPERWAYKYDRPGDMVKFIRLIPPVDDPEGQDPLPVGHRVGAIYANEPSAKAEYIPEITETASLPQYFLDAFAFLLARDLAMPMTRKQSLWDALDQRYEFQLSRASEIDAAQEQSTYTRGNDYIQARGGGVASDDDYWFRGAR